MKERTKKIVPKTMNESRLKATEQRKEKRKSTKNKGKIKFINTIMECTDPINLSKQDQPRNGSTRL